MSSISDQSSRSLSSSRGRAFDCLRLKAMVFQASHGCSAAEREIGATFSVDVELKLDLQSAIIDDNLEATVDVAEVYDVVREVMLGPPRNLVETLAGMIADGLLERFPAERVRVCVHKDRAPMAGVTKGYEVEIIRP